MIYNEIPIAFIWYDNQQKQHVLQENAQNVCFKGLICGQDKLLPFQFRKNSTAKPKTWKLIKCCGDFEVDLTANINLIKAVATGEGIYVYYDGDDMYFKKYDNSLQPLNIPTGIYYSILQFEDDEEFYSEVFQVVSDLSVMVKLTFWDMGDINPIKYHNITFKQVVYLDTFISSSEPEIEEEGEYDVKNVIVPTFQKMTVKHRMSIYAPDYLKVALTSLQMHSNIELEAPAQGREGIISRVEVTATVEEDISYGIVSMLLVEEILVKTNCNEVIQIINNDPWG